MSQIIIAVLLHLIIKFLKSIKKEKTLEEEITAALAKEITDEIDNEIIKQLQGIANDK